jgi:hypothetical protein
MKMHHLLLGASLGIPSVVCDAAAQVASVVVPVIQPRAEDVRTLDGMIKAFYEVISGPAGEPRQWARDRTLYTPDVRFISMGMRDGKPHATIMSHQQFVDRSDQGLVTQGFYEQEIHRVTRKFGNTTHVFSTYVMKDGNGGEIGRGVNSIQLFWDGDRWWISGVAWDDERPDNPSPPDLLPG